MKLNYKRTFFIGFAFMSICAFWQLYDNLIPLILSNTFGLGESMTGAIMALDNVLALFLLPLFGALSDKTHTRLGKRTPFIILGTIFAVIFMIIIPVADQLGSFVLFFISLGVVLVAMGAYRSPAVALMPDVTPKPLRSSANSIINLMGTLGAIFTLIMSSILIPKVNHPNYIPIYITVAILMIVAVSLLVITIRENELVKENEKINSDYLEPEQEVSLSPAGALPREVKRSLIFILASVFLWFTAYNAVTTAFTRYADKVWGLQGGSFANTLLVATGAATLSYLPIGFLSGRFGRKKTVLGGILLMTLSYFSGFWFTSFSPGVFVIFAFTGIGWAAINVNSYPMVVEMSRGSEVGKYTGLYYTFSMSAQIFTPILSGILLEHISYRTLFPYSFCFSILSFCTMLCVKHGDSKPAKKRSALEHFDVDD
ncbi:MFS transporter [Anaerocolumna sp. AGMB13025]|uniref:MFS transporter n=1 Tax=Anaerocolumna sp. AGMB13025 TaxID=3039116 RepID=UPI00241C1797|nr:MFS transporter [Anaerocolumna sp. AGMB13025]WFR58037.1 MFS transporter [Anaerocolumna sp. AGMB13025]